MNRLEQFTQDRNNPNKIVVRAPDGSVGTVDKTDFESYSQEGFTALSAPDIDKYTQELATEPQDTESKEYRIHSVLTDLRNPNKIPMVSADGEFGTINKEDIGDAIQQGFREANKDDIVNKLKEIHYSGALAGTEAALAGAARGATMGMSDVSLTRPIESGLAGIVAAPFGEVAKAGVALGLEALGRKAPQIAGAALLGLPGREEVQKVAAQASELYETYKDRQKERLADLKDYQKPASIAGEIAGMIIPAIMSGGTSAGARSSLPLVERMAGKVGEAGARLEFLGSIKATLPTPSVAASLIGRSVERGIQNKLIGQSEQTLANRMFAPLISKTAGGAVEGAMYGTVPTVSKIGLEEDDLTGTAILSDVGISALAGGAIGTLFGVGSLGGTGVKGAAKGITNKVLDIIERQPDKKWAGKIKEGYNKLASFRTNASIDDIRKIFTKIDLSDDALSRIGISADSIQDIKTNITGLKNADYNKLIKTFTSQIDYISKVSDDNMEILYTFLDGAADVIKLSPEQKYRIIQNISQIIKQSDSAIFDMLGNPAEYTNKTAIKQLWRINRQLESQLTPIIAPAGVPFSAGLQSLQDVELITFRKLITSSKRQLDLLSNFGPEMRPIDKPTLNKVRSIRDLFKNHLISNTLYGNIGSETNAVNILYSEYRANIKNMLKFFGTKKLNKKGIQELTFDEGRFKTYLDDIGAPKNNIKSGVFNSLIKSITENYAPNTKDIIKRLNDLPSLPENILSRERLLLDAWRNLAEMADSMEDVANVLHITNRYAVLNQIKKISGGWDTADALGAFGAAIGGLHPMDAIWFAARIGKNPATDAIIVNKSAHILRKFNNLIDTSIGGFFERSASKTQSIVQPLTIKSAEKTYSEMTDLSENKERFIDEFEDATSPLFMTMPNTFINIHARVSDIIDYVENVRPQKIQLDPLDPKSIMNPSEYELKKFAHIAEVARNPNVVMSELKQGIMDRDSIIVLKDLYPEVYDRMKNKMLEIMHSKDISYQTRNAIMLFLDVAPENLLSIQSVYAGQQEPQQQQTKQVKEGAIKRQVESQKSATDKLNR